MCKPFSMNQTGRGYRPHMERWLIAVGVALFVLVLVLVAAGYLATMGVVGRHIASAFKAVPTDYGLKSEVISFRSTDRVDLKG